MAKNILIADDDAHIREVVKFSLEKANFNVVEAQDGEQALSRFNPDKIDLVILDIMMPECDGTDVCRQIRSRADTPIIFLTSKDEEIDRIIGLEIGGDDYVIKPFSPRELVARVKVILRRLEGRQTTNTSSQVRLIVGKLSLCADTCRVSYDEKNITLTATEFGMLQTLMRHPHKVFSRDELMNQAYGQHIIVSDRTIDSHIRRLRAKFSALEVNAIETQHGFGYRLHPEMSS